MRYNIKRLSGGFTLIEILLVVSLTTILMLAMTNIFSLASRVVSVTDAELEVRQVARGIISRMEADLQSLVVDESYNYFILNNDSINRLQFITSSKYNPEGLAGRTDITQIAYQLLGRSGTLQLQEERFLPPDESEVSLLARISLTYISEEQAAKFNTDNSMRRPLRAYTSVRFNPTHTTSWRQYVDVIAGRLTDFRVEHVSQPSVLNMSGFDLVNMDSYWMSSSLSINQSTSNPKLPRALRVSFSLHDRRKLIERGFETIIPIRFSRLKGS